jgi:tetratricopeptide (TPR) repeat protein
VVLQGDAYQPPEQYRSLAEIYSELGHTLMRLGREAEQPDEARRRYAEAAQAFREAIRADPSSATLHLALAGAREAQGQPDEALRAYLEALRLAPSRAAEVLERAHALLTPDRARGLGDWLDTRWRPSLGEMEAEGAALVDRFLGRASLYRGDYPRAARYYQVVLEHDPDDPYSLEGLGEALWHTGQEREAIELQAQATRRADEMGDEQRRVRTRLKLARSLMRLERYEEALEVIEQGLAMREGAASAELLVAYGRCWLELGQAERALEAARQALAPGAGNPGSAIVAEAHAIQAAALYEAKQYGAAATAAEAALAVEPDHPLALRIRAQAMLDGGIDHEQALRLLQVYVRREPRDMARQRLLIDLLRDSGRSPAEVEEAIQWALAQEARPEEKHRLRLELAEAQLQQGRWQEAMRQLAGPVEAEASLESTTRAGTVTDPDQTLRWWMAMGDAQRQAGQMEEALWSYRRALALAPTHPALLQRQAEVLEAAERLPEALSAWRAYLEAEPGDAAARLRLAQRLHESGQWEAALREVEGALEWGLESDQEAAAYQLKGELLLALERPGTEAARAFHEAGVRQYDAMAHEEATALFERAIAQDPEFLPAYWYLSDTLRQRSHSTQWPYVDQAMIARSLEVWNEGAAIQQPDRDYAWAHIARALIGEALARLPGVDRGKEWWTSVLHLERGLLLDSENAYAWTYLARYHGWLLNGSTALHAARQALAREPENVVILEEWSTLLSDTGNAAQGLEVIRQRKALGSSGWADSLEVYSLFTLKRYEEALALLDNIIQTQPDAREDLWHRYIRARLYHILLGIESAARQEYQWVWEYGREREDAGNLHIVAWAAYLLDRTEEALEIYRRVLWDPAQRSGTALRCMGLCYLKQGELERGEQLLMEGTQRALLPNDLDELYEVDLEDLQKLARAWSHGEKIPAIVSRLRAAIEQRQSELQQPSADVEMAARELAAWQDGSVPEAYLSQHTEPASLMGLARLRVEQEKWSEAARLYRGLQDDLPEARTGFENVVRALTTQGATYLGENNLPAALDRYQEALELLASTGEVDQSNQAEMHAQLGYIHLAAGNDDSARLHFLEALALHRAAGTSEPGSALGAVGSRLVQDPGKYWMVLHTLERYAGELRNDNQASMELLDAREALAPRLDGLFRLEATSGETASLPPIITPIAVEIGASLIPDETGEDWPVISRYIPEMRARIQQAMGVEIPGIRIRDGSNYLAPEQYMLMLEEVPLESGSVQPARRFSPLAPELLQARGIPPANLTPTPHPLTLEEGAWVAPESWEQVTAPGLDLWEEPIVYVIYHLEGLLRRNLADLVGQQEVAALAQGRITEPRALARFGRLLRALLQEQVSIVAWEEILDLAQDETLDGGTDFHGVLRAARLRLKRFLPGNSPTDSLRALPEWLEEEMLAWLRSTDGRTTLAVPVEAVSRWMDAINEVALPLDSHSVLVTDSPLLRPFARWLVKQYYPNLMVIAREEVTRA